MFTSYSTGQLFAHNALLCSSPSATNTSFFILLTEGENLRVVFVSGPIQIASMFSVTQFHLTWLFCLCPVCQAHAAFTLHSWCYYFIGFIITLLIIQDVYTTKINLSGFLFCKVFQLTLRLIVYEEIFYFPYTSVRSRNLVTILRHWITA